MLSSYFVCLFVCQHDNFRTIKRRMMKLGGAYPLRDFQEICGVHTLFQDALTVKISMDLLNGLRSYGVLSRGRLVSPKSLAPPVGETMRRTPNVFEVQERARITVPILVRLGFYPPPGRPKRSSLFLCLSVCFFVTLLNVRVCAPDFAMKALEC